MGVFIFIIMKSTLTEELSRVKSLMGINESPFLRRRFPPEEIQHTIKDALVWATQRWKRHIANGNKTTPVTLKEFAHSVIHIAMDEFHPKLIENLEPFPYNEIFEFLSETFHEQIYEKYLDEFGDN